MQEQLPRHEEIKLRVLRVLRVLRAFVVNNRELNNL